MELQLVLPNKQYLSSYIDAIREYEENHVKTYSFSNPSQYDIFEKFDLYRLGENLPQNRIQQTTYWLVLQDEFIGEIAIRHQLNDTLLKRGGNIGYGIRYSKWNQGYGTKMLELALQEVRKMGMKRVLITCNDHNYGSAKVIENNGGILENVIENDVEGEKIKTKRYWIDL